MTKMTDNFCVPVLLFASDGVEAADVGIDDGENPTSSSSSSSDDELSPKSGRRLLPAPAFTQITYVHIHQCNDFSVSKQGGSSFF